MALNWKHNATRGWYTPYRGPLLIHAAKRAVDWPSAEIQELFVDVASQPTDLPRGAILCRVMLVDCQRITAESLPSGTERILGDYTPGRFMWITEHIETFRTPIPFSGRQGLFDVPEQVLTQMER